MTQPDDWYDLPVLDPPIPKTVRFAEAPAVGRSILATSRNRRKVSALAEELKQIRAQQAASAEILKAINNASTTDLSPVFDLVLKKAIRTCDAAFGVLFLAEDGKLKPAASAGVPARYAEFMQRRGSFFPEVGAPLYRVMKTLAPVHTADDTKEERPGPAATYGGARSLIGAPIIHEGQIAGAFILYRTQVKAFSLRQVASFSSTTNNSWTSQRPN